jgi:hypothetical protein
MKQLISVLVVVFCALSLPGPGVVQAQMLTPSYLSEMPTPARVVNEIKGKDAADSGARQLGSLHALHAAYIKRVDMTFRRGPTSAMPFQHPRTIRTHRGS